MDSNLGDVMASTPQSRNRLENRGGEDDEISRRVWKAVETEIREVRMAEAKEGENCNDLKLELRLQLRQSLEKG